MKTFEVTYVEKYEATWKVEADDEGEAFDKVEEMRDNDEKPAKMELACDDAPMGCTSIVAPFPAGFWRDLK